MKRYFKKDTGTVGLVIILISFIISLYFYPRMPEFMASHWNIRGEVDGYMQKSWGLFLMPVISVILLFLFTKLPEIDPLKRNVRKFRKQFDRFIVLLLLFLFYINILVIVWNLGVRINIGTALIPAFSILFYYIGVLLKETRRNWFVGIKTPWTLSSSRVWRKTHERASLLFKACAIFPLLAIFDQTYAFFLLLIPMLFTIAYLFVYSYLEFKKEKN